MEPSSIKSKRADPYGIKFYLIAYNALQTIGWIILSLQFCNYYISSDPANNSLYQNIKWPLLISQSAAVLEIIHTITGIVPSNPIFTSIQVFLRFALTCGVFPNVIGAQNCLGFPIAILAWSITEIVRYAYYTLNLVNMVPYFLKWCRYSTFIVLYPIGTLGELHCLYAGQKKFTEMGLWDNKPSNLVVMLLLVAPLIIQLYKHMLLQRRKVLGATDATKIK